MKQVILLTLILSNALPIFAQQKATIVEEIRDMKTYPFSDPDPVAKPFNLYYPYFRFDEFASKSVERPWKVVEMENDYIRLTLFPEIGGKVWGAVEKSTQQEFIYHNHVVKFRDIAMRGPWVSGGIEFNFGIIGHAPTSSTPVDYLLKEKEDGSVSCYISSYELVTRTYWMVEVNLPADKGYFTTKTTWFNASSIDQPYYQWMNAGYKVAGDVQFCYPGNSYIGHNGELYTFPLDEEGRDISWYKNNNYGNSKSYHVLGYYNDFYGAYWHEDNFGSVHHAAYEDKLGMKIFLWGQAREGGIWEELLTDTDGQYVELQSGRMYNQPSSGSGFTPYKHTAFGPQTTDQWIEYWYPVKGIGGIKKASPIGALNVSRTAEDLTISFSPVAALSTQLKMYDGNKLIYTIPVQTKVLEPWQQTISLSRIDGNKPFRFVVGENDLVYSEVLQDNETSRPKELPSDFDWNSAYGLYIQGEQWLNQKVHDQSEKYLKTSLEKDPWFIPALVKLASLYYRQGKYEEGLSLCKKALSVHTYDAELNYIYGLCNQALSNLVDAKDGFSVATQSPVVRTAAYVKLGEIALAEKDWKTAQGHALKALEFNRKNYHAYQVILVAQRKTAQMDKNEQLITSLLNELPLYHPFRFEAYLIDKDVDKFISGIQNELPFETFMELAEWYEGAGCYEEAIEALSFAGDYPVALYKSAWLTDRLGDKVKSQELLQKVTDQSPDYIFPFRPSGLKALEWAANNQSDWKPGYYQALIYWHNQQPQKALTLMENCGNPSYVPFYLSRALLKVGEKQLEDLKMAEKIKPDWRTGLALISYYSGQNDWNEAMAVGKQYSRQYPDNYYIGLKYAKALCETGNYQTAIRLLRKLQVLPNEGAYAGRAVFREANLAQAMQFLARKNYKQAFASIEASKEWPENLGVGKPYDDMIDDRVENYLAALIYKAQGNPTKAQELFRLVADYGSYRNHFLSTSLLTAMALRELGNNAEADRMVDEWKNNKNGSRVIEWAITVYSGESQKAAQLLKGRYDTTETTPWETTYRDTDFNLISRLFSE